jgi:NAD-dependent deacetylase
MGQATIRGERRGVARLRRLRRSDQIRYVSFGQAMPEAAMRRAEELSLACDLFLVAGSSLVVWPAAGFPLMAKRNGARLAIINRESTEFDEIADLVIRDDIGTVLAPFILH